MKKLLLLLFLIPIICLAELFGLPDDAIKSRLPRDNFKTERDWLDRDKIILDIDESTRSFCTEQALKAEPYMAWEIERSCLNDNNASY